MTRGFRKSDRKIQNFRKKVKILEAGYSHQIFFIVYMHLKRE